MNAKIGLLAIAAMALSAGAQSATANGGANATAPGQTAVSQASEAAANSSRTSVNNQTTAHAAQASAATAQSTDVSAELTRRIDAKNAKVGEQVLAKTTENARLADVTRLPKGSRLVGHVTEVQAKSHADDESHVAFAFDHAVLRDGREIPIQARMESISAPSAMMAGSASDDAMAGGGMGPGPSMAGGPGMARGGGGGMVGGGGGLVGGAGGALRGTTSAAGGLAGNTAEGLGATTNGAMNTTGALGRNSADLSGAGGADSSLAGSVRPVGNLSGVTFSNVNLSGSASRSGVDSSAGSATATMLSAHGKNVDLASGSQMTLSLTPQ